MKLIYGLLLRNADAGKLKEILAKQGLGNAEVLVDFDGAGAMLLEMLTFVETAQNPTLSRANRIAGYEVLRTISFDSLAVGESAVVDTEILEVLCNAFAEILTIPELGDNDFVVIDFDDRDKSFHS